MKSYFYTTLSTTFYCFLLPNIFYYCVLTFWRCFTAFGSARRTSNGDSQRLIIVPFVKEADSVVKYGKFAVHCTFTFFPKFKNSHSKLCS